jgi:DNA polymerase-3 subunit delta'
MMGQYPWLTPVFDQLSQMWQTDRFHHALLLQGGQGMGKTELVKFVANGLICNTSADLTPCGHCKSCLLIKAGTHPDCQVLDKQDQSIGIDDIRQSTAFVYQKSQISPRRVLLIHNAQKLTESAANALLKTLEEPCPDVYILLTTNNPQRLLPTLRSRCFKMDVNAVDRTQAFRWLEAELASTDQNITPKQFARLFALANNAPLRVLEWVIQGKLPEVEQLTEQFEQWMNNSISAGQIISTLEKSDFALLLFHQLLIRHLKSKQLTDVTDANGQLFVTIDQIFGQVTRFNRVGVQIIGQNKSLALTKLITQIQILLKDRH